MKQILLLTDFSKNSKNAINYALALFENEACHFTILHIPTKSVYTTSDLMSAGNKSIYDSLVKKAKHKLEKFVKTLETASLNKNTTFEPVVDYDTLTDSVNQIINKNKIDLIVMGTNGATGAKEVIFGSNTINVIRKVDCSTLVVPKGFLYKKPESIFLPLDMLDSLNSHAFLKLKNYIKQFNTSLNILRINPKDDTSIEVEKDQEYIQTHLKHVTHSYQLVKNMATHDAVDNYLQTQDIDLMALLVQKETAFERFLTGSETKKISQDLKVPLLILHSD
ncbi:universal stress protein [Xanthomarina sp. F2636L]|uniref:universal stress protein n=1 Tax=Xanthomarina sp. F2636L TaxID=2996018 RepID=UPI00225DD798|nr:universal stress protein [Xanthomarina sp. F2636L]MCX7551742.1 universal stress protein [Xanthomarina sp. F2636L]